MIPVFALFAVCSSNIAFDITPDTLVVAIGITASVPSEEAIVLAPVVPLILKSVDTFVFFAVFAVIADACPPLIVVVSPASAVDELVPNCKVVTEPPSEIAAPSIVIPSFAKLAFAIAVPFHTPVAIVPVSYTHLRAHET